MAASTRGGGPGSFNKNGVRSTMNAPFSKAASSRSGSGPGLDGQNHAPFDKPQGMAGGSIPTRFFDTAMNARTAKTVPAGQVSPPIGGTQNVGTRRFKNAK